MIILNFVLGILASAAAAWWLTRAVIERKQGEVIQGLEARARASEGAAHHLKEQVGTLRGEVVSLQKTLSDERVSKQESIAALTGAFQKGMMGIVIAAFVTGSGISGGLSWTASSWHTEVKMTSKNMEEKVQYELTKLRLELLEKQYAASEEDRERFQSAWQEERILRAKAETRVEIMSRGFSVPENFGNSFLNDSGLGEENPSSESPNRFLSFIRSASLKA